MSHPFIHWCIHSFGKSSLTELTTYCTWLRAERIQSRSRLTVLLSSLVEADHRT
ncbi:mCG1040867 [Mus musculus]|nr:mCG1040867 [Mus musculus]